MATIKYSRQREAIKTYLQSREDHPTADMVYHVMREKFPNISLGTVYRNLSLLTELGEIQKITTGGAERYDARTADHSHFVCRECGCVMDVIRRFDDLTSDVNEHWSQGEIEGCQVLFYGICKNCKKNKISC